MDQLAMQPFGAALRAYFDGDTDAQLTIRTDGGLEAQVPVSYFFRERPAFTSIENGALARCAGHVLDVGAGTGLHSLALIERGLQVTALDINPQAVEIMAERGVEDVRCADVLEYDGGPFQTLLLMGHGIGMVETLAGLDRFLAHAHGLLLDEGQILMHSLDVGVTDDPNHLAYHEKLRKEGRYIGEIRQQIEYRDLKGPYCGWLHVDADTLTEHAGDAGWNCQVVMADDSGDYLARLTRRKAA